MIPSLTKMDLALAPRKYSIILLRSDRCQQSRSSLCCYGAIARHVRSCAYPFGLINNAVPSCEPRFRIRDEMIQIRRSASCALCRLRHQQLRPFAIISELPFWSARPHVLSRDMEEYASLRSGSTQRKSRHFWCPERHGCFSGVGYLLADGGPSGVAAS